MRNRHKKGRKQKSQHVQMLLLLTAITNLITALINLVSKLNE